ncbi:conserved membrane hypothetical protein [Tenacibaculum sp. 190524A02b]|uniref:Uncharacterized protein n=1 Tax=Tenacibaculum vairaonense TaxID=3137860 RepID=A0ABP1FBP1_9FLAO
MAKISIYSRYIFVAVAIVTAFFIHEIPPNKSKAYLEAKENYLNSREERTIALERLKNISKNTSEYKEYKKQAKKADEKWAILKKVKQNDSFLGFKNFQHFLGEFGWAFGLFIYSFSCFIISCKERNGFKDIKLLHIPVIFISIFYIIYTIQPFPDYPKIAYIFTAVILTIFLSISVYIVASKNLNSIFSLKENIRDLVGFVLNNTKETKESDKWNLLEKISKRI